MNHPSKLRCLKIARGLKMFMADPECWNCLDRAQCDLFIDEPPPRKRKVSWKCPKCRKGTMVVNPNYPTEERRCDACGYMQVCCGVCGNWGKNHTYGNCKKCAQSLDKVDSETLKES
jgi:hypothetical protein